MNLYQWLPISMLAATLTYALWCQLRPLLFESDIESIRQNLWDTAHGEGQLADPAVVQALDSLEKMQHATRMLTLETFLYFVMTSSPDGRPAPRPEPSTLRMRTAVKDAEAAASERIFRFISRETAGALIFRVIAGLASDERVGKQMRQKAFDCFA